MRLTDIFEDSYKERQLSRDFRDSLQGHYTDVSQLEKHPTFTHWPPTAQEMREAERMVLQDPQWLARWAYFGWTSFTMISDNMWQFDQRKQVFAFREVPHLSYMPKKSKIWKDAPGFKHPNAGQVTPDRRTLYVTLDGKVVNPYGKTEYGHLHVPLKICLQQIRDFVKSKAPQIRENLKWMSGGYYIRFGLWPKNERSQNFLDHDPENPIYEKGVSAYHATFDAHEGRWAIEDVEVEDGIAGTLQSLIYGKRDVYLVQGDEIGETGSDGEPLLHNVKLIKKLSRRDVYMPGVFDPREDMDEYR